MKDPQFIVTRCPKGHTNVDYVALDPRWYVYCYDCGRKYHREDYEEE